MFIKRKIKLLIIFFSVGLFTGCLRTYYPAIDGAGAPPMFFESRNFPNKNNSYLGADVTFSGGFYEDEYLYLGRINYTIVSTENFFNFNAKAFGYSGLYHVEGLAKYNGNKNFFGLGTDLGFNFNFKISSFKFGLGLNAGMGIESGEYYLFKKNGGNEGLIKKTNSPFFGIISFFPVAAYEFSDSGVLSFQMNFGLPGLVSPSLVYNNNGYIYWLSFLPSEDTKRIKSRFMLGCMINISHLW